MCKEAGRGGVSSTQKCPPLHLPSLSDAQGMQKVLALCHISDHGMLISSKERGHGVVQNAYYRLLGPKLGAP